LHRIEPNVPAMISVVIPTCGRPDLLACCLDRLAPGVQTLPAERYEVVVTDDGKSTVQQFLAEKYPWVSWGAGPRRGPAANRNAGARRARGAWIAFADDDCLPDRAWLAAFATASHDGCNVYEGKTTCEAGIHSPMDHSPVNLTGGCLWSCNMLIGRATFESLGGFDEGFPYPYMEDSDLRERLVNAGYSFEFVPAAVVDHPPRPMTPGRRLGRQHESWVYFWYKRGFRKLAAPRLLDIVVTARVKAMFEHKIGVSTLQAMGSLAAELFTLIPRLPYWELRYRRRFLGQTTR
jgi:GT2 family glycosyltransferase